VRWNHFAAAERCYWCNDVTAVMSHHVPRRNDGTTDRMSENSISASVYYVHLGRDNNAISIALLSQE